jgi:acetyl esterase/lipase
MPLQPILHVYKKVIRHSIHADVYLPSTDNPPVVLYFHGGALISGSRKYLPAYQASRLAAEGLAVVSFDYRLAPETKLAEIVQDVQDAVLWAKGEGARTFGFDPTRTAAMGGSAGGYLSLLSGTFAVKPEAIVSFYGYGDILGEWYTRPSPFYCQRPMITLSEAENAVGKRVISAGENNRYTFYFYCRQQGAWPEAVSGLNPVSDRAALLRYCPAYNVAPDYPPALLLHGDQDTDVPYEQSVQMAAALERNGTPNRLVTLKGGGHGFDGDEKDPQVQRIWEMVVEFLGRELGKK